MKFAQELRRDEQPELLELYKKLKKSLKIFEGPADARSMVEADASSDSEDEGDRSPSRSRSAADNNAAAVATAGQPGSSAAAAAAAAAGVEAQEGAAAQQGAAAPLAGGAPPDAEQQQAQQAQQAQAQAQRRPGAPDAAQEARFTALVEQCVQQLNDDYLSREEMLVIKADLAQSAAYFASSREELSAAYTGMVNLHGELVLLCHWSMTAYTGIVKILKKHYKRTGQRVQSALLANLLAQPFCSLEVRPPPAWPETVGTARVVGRPPALQLPGAPILPLLALPPATLPHEPFHCMHASPALSCPRPAARAAAATCSGQPAAAALLHCRCMVVPPGTLGFAMVGFSPCCLLHPCRRCAAWCAPPRPRCRRWPPSWAWRGRRRPAPAPRPRPRCAIRGPRRRPPPSAACCPAARPPWGRASAGWGRRRSRRSRRLGSRTGCRARRSGRRARQRPRWTLWRPLARRAPGQRSSATAARTTQRRTSGTRRCGAWAWSPQRSRAPPPPAVAAACRRRRGALPAPPSSTRRATPPAAGAAAAAAARTRRSAAASCSAQRRRCSCGRRCGPMPRHLPPSSPSPRAHNTRNRRAACRPPQRAACRALSTVRCQSAAAMPSWSTPHVTSGTCYWPSCERACGKLASQERSFVGMFFLRFYPSPTCSPPCLPKLAFPLYPSLSLHPFFMNLVQCVPSSHFLCSPPAVSTSAVPSLELCGPTDSTCVRIGLCAFPASHPPNHAATPRGQPIPPYARQHLQTSPAGEPVGGRSVVQGTSRSFGGQWRLKQSRGRKADSRECV